MKRIDTKPMERVSISWTPTLLAKLRRFAADHEITLADAVRRLVEEGMARHGG